VGLDWKKLKATLNPTFDWDSAVQAALRSTDSIEDVRILYFAIELKSYLHFVIVLKSEL